MRRAHSTVHGQGHVRERPAGGRPRALLDCRPAPAVVGLQRMRPMHPAADRTSRPPSRQPCAPPWLPPDCPARSCPPAARGGLAPHQPVQRKGRPRRPEYKLTPISLALAFCTRPILSPSSLAVWPTNRPIPALKRVDPAESEGGDQQADAQVGCGCLSLFPRRGGVAPRRRAGAWLLATFPAVPGAHESPKRLTLRAKRHDTTSPRTCGRQADVPVRARAPPAPTSPLATQPASSRAQHLPPRALGGAQARPSPRGAGSGPGGRHETN